MKQQFYFCDGSFRSMHVFGILNILRDVHCCVGKAEVIEFMGIYPDIICDHWTIIRNKVMNEQNAVKNRLRKYM